MAVLAMVVIALVAGTAGAIAAVAGHAGPRPADDVLAPIDGYPQRISFERPSPALPDRPGALAATMYDNDFGNRRELGVTSRGRLWELPHGINVLSPDGRLLLTTPSGEAPSRLTVRDLSTGDVRAFDDIGSTIDVTERRAFTYVLDPNGPAYWSPDSSRVLAPFSVRAHRGRYHPMVLDVGSGVLTEVSGGVPAGFTSPSEAVTLTVGREDDDGEIVVATTDLVTGQTRTMPLTLTTPWSGAANSRLVAGVSPDAATLLLVQIAEHQFPDATLRRFSLVDGSELTPRSIRGWDGCPPVWLGDDPVLPTKSPQAGSELVSAAGSRPLVAVHHRLQSSCLQLTAAALEAGPHRALLGTWTSVWTWYWWQLLVAASLALLVAALLVWRRVGRLA